MTHLWITHPDTGGVAMVSQESHDEVWAHLGWQPIPIDLSAASVALGGPVVRADQLTEDYVRGLIAPPAPAPVPAPAVSIPPAAPASPTPSTSSARRGRKASEETV